MRIRILALLAVLGFFLVTSVNVALAQGGGGQAGGQGRAGARGGGAPATPLRLTSSAFADTSRLDPKYTCSAGDAAVNPPLAWANAPAGTVSFALIFHDLEPRPRRGIEDILHWMVWDIPATTMQLPENVPNTSSTLPDGSLQSNGNAQGPNLGYRPPCPPAGPPHHYTFELFALDQKLALPAAASRADVMKAMDGHVLGHAVLMGLYNR
jgi:Raf kinase inhibitor-like YbhB/YbcL family protein